MDCLSICIHSKVYWYHFACSEMQHCEEITRFCNHCKMILLSFILLLIHCYLHEFAIDLYRCDTKLWHAEEKKWKSPKHLGFNDTMLDLMSIIKSMDLSQFTYTKTHKKEKKKITGQFFCLICANWTVELIFSFWILNVPSCLLWHA